MVHYWTCEFWFVLASAVHLSLSSILVKMFYEDDEQSVALQARLATTSDIYSGSLDDGAGLETLLLSSEKIGQPALARLKAAAMRSAEQPGRSLEAAEFLKLVADEKLACFDVRSPAEVINRFEFLVIRSLTLCTNLGP